MEFTWKDVKFRFHFLFFWMFTFLLLIDRNGVVLLGMLAAMIHELGHIIAFFLTGDTPSEISFEICGIRMIRKKETSSYGRQLFQLLMGSGTNFAVFLFLLYSLDSINQISLFAVSHLILGVFNLLPVQALDGGKIIRLWLDKYLNPNQAYQTVRLISMITTGLLLTAGIWLIMTKKTGYSLIPIGIWMLIVCVKGKAL